MAISFKVNCDPVSMTSLPLILAEELDADRSKVVAVPAPPIDKNYGNPGLWGVMLKDHSISVTGYFTPLRTFGAKVAARILPDTTKPIPELVWGDEGPINDFRPRSASHHHSRRSSAMKWIARQCRWKRFAGR